MVCPKGPPVISVSRIFLGLSLFSFSSISLYSELSPSQLSLQLSLAVTIHVHTPTPSAEDTTIFIKPCPFSSSRLCEIVSTGRNNSGESLPYFPFWVSLQNTPNVSLFIPIILLWPHGCVLDVKSWRNTSGRLPRISSEKPIAFEPISGQTTASWPACKVSISSSRRVLQLFFLFHPISLSIEEVILIWILPSFRRPPRLSRRFSAKPRRVRRRARYHSLSLFENYNFRFYLTWFRWVVTKLWTFKVWVVFRPKFRPSSSANPGFPGRSQWKQASSPFGFQPKNLKALRPSSLGLCWAQPETKLFYFLCFIFCSVSVLFKGPLGRFSFSTRPLALGRA